MCTQFKSIHIVTRPFKAYMYIYQSFFSRPQHRPFSPCTSKMHLVAAETTSPGLMNRVFSHFGHHFHPEKKRKKKKNLAARLSPLLYKYIRHTPTHTHTHSRDNQAVAPPPFFWCLTNESHLNNVNDNNTLLGARHRTSMYRAVMCVARSTPKEEKNPNFCCCCCCCITI